MFSTLTVFTKTIVIHDATIFQVSNQLAAVNPGFGEGGTVSGVQIQLECDLLIGQFLHIEVGPGK